MAGLLAVLVVVLVEAAVALVPHSVVGGQVLCLCRSLVVACVALGRDVTAGVSVEHADLVHWSVVVHAVRDSVEGEVLALLVPSASEGWPGVGRW